MTNQEIIQTLKELYLNNSDMDALVETARKQCFDTLLKRQQKKDEAKKQHDVEQIEKLKPVIRGPQLEKHKHVYMQDYLNYYASYDLDELENYLAELFQGKHRHDYTDPDNAIQCMKIQIDLRKSHLNPTEEQARLLRETKTELMKAKSQAQDMAQKITEAKDDIKAVGEALKPPTQDKPKMDYSR